MSCNQTGEVLEAGIGRRPVHLRNFEVMHGHKHNRDHLSIFCGPVSVERWKDCRCASVTEKFNAGDCLLIKADWFHEITPLADDVKFLCVFASPNSESLQDAYWDVAEARP